MPEVTAETARLTFATFLADALGTVGDVITGPVQHANGVVAACRGDVRAWGEIVVEPGLHPNLAHVHVITEIGHGAQTKLDACVLGIDPDPTEALRDAANNWLRLAGAPILALVTQRYVLDADHFGDADAWGVPGMHGFVGPASARGSLAGIDFDALGTASFFRDAASLIADDGVHLLKSTISPSNGAWRRTLELDGHAAARVDEAFAWELAPPTAPVALARFAVVFRGA